MHCLSRHSLICSHRPQSTYSHGSHGSRNSYDPSLNPFGDDTDGRHSNKYTSSASLLSLLFFLCWHGVAMVMPQTATAHAQRWMMDASLATCLITNLCHTYHKIQGCPVDILCKANQSLSIICLSLNCYLEKHPKKIIHFIIFKDCDKTQNHCMSFHFLCVFVRIACNRYCFLLWVKILCFRS